MKNRTETFPSTSDSSIDDYQYFYHNVSTKVMGAGHNKDGTQRYKLQTEQIPMEKIEEYYVQDTDTLIGMFDGAITESSHYIDGKQKYEGPIDRAIYLDKSARPVARIVRKLHPELANSTDSFVPPASFLNIDKEDYLSAMGFDARELQNIDPDLVDLDKLDPDYRKQITAEMRAMYISSDDLSKLDEDNIQDVWNMPTILDGKHVAVIDEVKSSGNSLRIANMLIQEAIPEAKVEPMYWSVPGLNRWTFTDEDGNAHDEFATSRVPVWYDSSRVDGRLGIADRNPQQAEQSRSKRVRLGKHVLSTMMRGGMDATSKKVAHDISLLAKRLEDKQIKYVPATDLDDDAFEQKVEDYWDMSFKEWVEKRRNGEI